MLQRLLKFNIDEKSLFYGIYNDYPQGQTATVSTPINQSKDQKRWKLKILDLRGTNARIHNNDIPEMLKKKCIAHSKASCEIKDVFVFNNILLDGMPIYCESQFCMYIKEEIDQKKVHYGRLKLHYPISFIHETDGFKINNQKVLEKILNKNGDYAFFVRGFEYNQDTKTLNFVTSMVGPKGILLSSVFRKGKGVGKKLLIDTSDLDTHDYYVVIEETKKNKVSNISFEAINASRIANGKKGEEIIIERLKKELDDEAELFHTSKSFPGSLYDIEYIEEGIKKYVEVKATQGNKLIFNMSSSEYKFMEDYKEQYKLYLVSNVNDIAPIVNEYKYEDIIKMRREHPTIRLYAEEV